MLRHDLPMTEYLAAPGVSASTLKAMQRSPAFAHLAPKRTSDALEWGTAVHAAILEPHTLESLYGLDPTDEEGGYRPGWRNTKQYKTARENEYAVNPGIIGLLTHDQWEALGTIRLNVARNDIGRQLHDLPGHRESSLFVTDAEGVARKCRPDWLIPSARMIVDVKTAKDWRPRAFARSAHGYGYHMSAAYYVDTFGIDEEAPFIEHYVFLVVASDAPYEVEAYTLDSDSLEQGRHDYRRALNQWRACKASGAWPGGSGKIQEIRLPEYGINYYRDDEEIEQW